MLGARYHTHHPRGWAPLLTRATQCKYGPVIASSACANVDDNSVIQFFQENYLLFN